MTDEINNPNNRVNPASQGKFHAFWNGHMAYENGRAKRFETESDAWEFLALCDIAGKIIN
jgi:hypothetical protein